MINFLQSFFSLLAFVSPFFMVAITLIAVSGQLYLRRQAKKFREAIKELENAQKEFYEIKEALDNRKLMDGEDLDSQIEALRVKIEVHKSAENGEPVDLVALAELEREFTETKIAAERVFGANSETRRQMEDLARRIPRLEKKLRARNEKIIHLRDSMLSPYRLHKVIPLLIDYIGNSEPGEDDRSRAAEKAASK